MTQRTVVVIHGVTARDESLFERQVEDLGRALGAKWRLVPVFWGDLGASEELVHVTVPRLGRPTVELHTPPPGEPVKDEAGLAVVLSHLPAELGGEGKRPKTRVPLRGSPGPPSDLDALSSCITEAWDSLTWLPQLADEDVAEAVAAAAAQAWIAATSVNDHVPGGQRDAARYDEPDDNKDWFDDVDASYEAGDHGKAGTDARALRGGRRRQKPSPSVVVTQQLSGMDRLVGAAITSVGGRVNSVLRRRAGSSIASFFGDVLVYQRHRDRIHRRVRERVAAAFPGAGSSPECAVDVIAHSLGGVIAVDLVASADPLWTARLVTFGSQAAFFHVCDPRDGIPPFSGQELVRLPPSLDMWTNLWEPLDPLAFVAGTVFRLANGRPPTDVMIPHDTSHGWWTQSAYWTMDTVTRSIVEALEAPVMADLRETDVRETGLPTS